MLHRRHCWCGDSRRPTDGSPGHGLAPLPSSRPCHSLPACCHEGFDEELNLRIAELGDVAALCPSPRPWLALMLALGGKSGSGLLPPPPEPLDLRHHSLQQPFERAHPFASLSSLGFARRPARACNTFSRMVLAMASRCAICCRRVPSLSFMGTKDARLRWVASTPRRLAWTSPRF